MVMPLPFQTGNRLDAFDLEAFEAMLESKPFHLYRERVSAELARVQSDCESLLAETELRRAQGAARALRAVLNMPETILKSIRSERDKRKT
jgi:hypothetical protein